MAPISLKIITNEGAVTRKVKFDSKITVREAHAIVKEKVIVPDPTKEHGLFLRSPDNDRTGIWMEQHRTLDYYMLRDGDSLEYICKLRNLRVKLLDGSIKTLPVNEGKTVSELMVSICGRLNITNHDEYGLCPEEDEKVEEGKEQPQTGTLTLKRAKPQPKERDVTLEQLSKKFNTDDHVHWLDQHSTLRELGVEPTDTVILKRRLFFSDRNVDQRDPVQLNLLYVQTRDAILNGKHLVTEEQAVEFAGIQCQIHFEDFQEEKHKPGFIENLNEFLPETYSSAWGVERKVLRAYRQHRGLAPLEAKNLYIRTARDLPTYGVTFFLVKEKQKGKKKLVPRLLGINAQAILRMDENTKEILQQWPLTHVKSYHVGKSETFALNFGDYSEKEYCCKTQDAFRIRDILEGYIDIIRRRMLAPPAPDSADSMAICHDNVQSGQMQIIQHIQNQPSKLVKESFVGPNRIVPFDQGSSAQQGTQVMTMQQMIETNQFNNPQRALKGEVAQHGQMPTNCVRTLKRMNSCSVKIVTLLAEPIEENINETQELTKNMKDHLPVVEMGVKEIVKQQTVEESQQMLLNEMQDLTNYVNKLSDAVQPGQVNTMEAKDAAEKIVDLTTSMYCAQDLKTRRRSELLNRSKKSFIADEKLDACIRRSSFLTAADSAIGGVAQAHRTVAQEYGGPHMDEGRVRQVELALQDHLGKLNAALALYLTAHSDPNNIDYSAAIDSMNTIKELMPELALEGQMLASTKPAAERKELVEDMRTLFEDTRKLCSLTATDDHEKMQDASSNYADIANKLLFTFTRGRNVGKENEIIELARDAGSKTSLLLMSANSLTALAPADAVRGVDAAGVRSAAAARDLLACAQLTAPAITEPHCQSALTAAATGLSLSVHQLSGTWKPLVEDPSRHELRDQLHQRELDVHRALERLQDAYTSLSGAEDESLLLAERQRLKFICSLSGARDNLKNLLGTWGTSVSESPVAAPAGGQKNPLLPELKEKAAQRRLAQQLAHLNGAVARLARATADPDRPDYVTAEAALNTISELMPAIVNDADVASARQDEATRGAMKQYVTGLCEASQHMFDNLDRLDDLGPAAAKFSASCKKLVFLISPGADKGKEKTLSELSSAAYDKSAAVLAHARHVQERLSPAARTALADTCARAEHAARALHIVTQVTSPSINDPSCSDTLASALQHLQNSINAVTATCYPHLQPGSQQYTDLNDSQKKLEDSLEKIAQVAHIDLSKDVEMTEALHPDVALAVQREKKRLQFINSLPDAKKRLDAAEQQIREPLACVMMRAEDAAVLQQQLGERVARLNAALALLARGTADRENPNYESVQQAVDTITQLMPELVQETCVLGATKSGETQNNLLQYLQQLHDAIRNIFDNAGQPKGLNEAASKLSDASGKLFYLVSPGASQEKGKEIIDLSSEACGRASELLSHVQALTQRLPGEEGEQLDRRGAKTADAAQALLTTAQVTAPTIASPHCLAALVSAAEQLQSSAKDLTSCCQPHLKPGHQEQLELQNSEEQLENSLSKLVQACKESPRRKPPPPPQQDKQRLHFINSLSGAKSCFDDAQQQLQQPVVCALMREEDAVALQHQLSDRMAQLNVAIAALTTATADRSHPDYASAQRAVSTITALLPQIVRDSKTLSGTKAGDTQQAMLQQVQQLCDASRAICDNAAGPQGLSEAAAKFSDASGKLMFTITPATDNSKEKQIIDLSSDACVRTSELLSHVQALTQRLPGEEGEVLDRRGARTADAAQALLTTAQVTAPTIASSHCSAALVSAAEQLRSSAKDLTSSCQPHLEPGHKEQLELQGSEEQLEDSLNNLVQACKESPCRKPPPPPQQDKQRLHFINSLSGAKSCFDDAHQQLQQPVVCALMREEEAVALQHQLSDRVAQLNAAVAALATATADRSHPDYASAQRAVSTITALLPQIVRDSKTLSGPKAGDTQQTMLQQVQQLCDASRAICDNAAGPQGLSEAAAKFSDASGKLMFTITPATDNLKEKQIIDLSSDACVRTSELLSRVQALTHRLPGEEGEKLDRRGARTADAAQALLTAAQMTAPTIASPHCSSALLSAAEQLRSTAKDLISSCQPHLKPGHQEQLELHYSEQQLEDSLNNLVQACKESPRRKPSQLQQQDKQRLHFINSLSEAKSCFDDAQQQLQLPVVCALMREEDAVALQRQLSDRVAQLNAAIAALTTATADRSHPDYASAQRAVNTISALLPQLVTDARTLSATKTGSEQDHMLQQVQQLCDSSKAVCDNAGQSQGLCEAAIKFSEASNNLMNNVTPRRAACRQTKQQKIIDLSAASCGRTSDLLSQVQALTQQIGGSAALDLDTRGSKTADSAQALLNVAKVTAPSISSKPCRKALEAAVQKLRDSAADLTDACDPHLIHGPQRQQLLETHQQLNNDLKMLLQASGVPLSREQEEKQRLQFINNLSGLTSCFDDVQQQLQQPVVNATLHGEEELALRRRLSDGLARLNAAVAKLALSTSDRSHPDYAAAQRAVSTITELLPQLVTDAKILSATKDGGAQQDMLLQVQQLCDASRAICDSAGEPQELNKAASRLSEASNNIMAAVHPEADYMKGQQIIDMAAESCSHASELLSQVQSVTQQLDGEAAVDLDSRGANTADAAQTLLAVAQVIAPSITSPQCQKELALSVDNLRESAADLQECCHPHVTSSAQRQQLEDAHQQLEDSLDMLLYTNDSRVVLSPAVQETMRVKFIRSVSALSPQMEHVEKQIKEPLASGAMTSAAAVSLQQQLSRRLAQLNLAIAALTSATTDHKNPDYPTAERSLITITELMPKVIQESKMLSRTKDDDSQRLIQQNLEELYGASRRICDHADDPIKLNESAAKFAVASRNLMATVAPRDEILESSGCKTKGLEGSQRPPQKPAIPVRSSRSVVSAIPSRSSCTTQDFLDALRTEEDNDNAARIVAAERKRGLTCQTDEEKYQLQQFSKAVDAAEKEIEVVEKSLKELQHAKITCDIDPLKLISKEQKIENTLARAGIEVAALVSANYADKLDYVAAQEPTLALGNSVRSVVEDGIKISGALPREISSSFVSDLGKLCGAANSICAAVRDDKEKLNDAAIAFGNHSAKLLHVVSANVNPAVEKEIIVRARAIGDSASRLALEATNVANNTSNMPASKSEQSHVQNICTAGAQCVDAAGKLVYTAKLVAPTIHHATCKEALASSADSLALKLAIFSDTWQPLTSDSHTEKLTEESSNLAQHLEQLKADVKSGRLGKRRDVDRLVVVDTPLRQMTVQIIDNARNMAEHGDLSPEVKKEYGEYYARLSDALRALDLAHARCQRAPHDKHRRNEMDIAIQDLQIIALQTRPSKAGQEQNNIVDFRDFLQGLAKESENLSTAVDKYQTSIDKRTADDIKLLCSKISEDSIKLMNPTQHAGYDSYEDIMEIYEFGQECDHLVKEINSMMRRIPEPKVKSALHAKLFPVVENCNYLRFATNSALSTAKSAAYEAALHDLDDFQSTVIKVIDTQRKQQERDREQCESLWGRSQGRLVRAGASAVRGEPQALRHALTSFCLSSPPKSDMLDGLCCLAQGVQRVTEINCLQSANWIATPESGYTDPLIQEINKVRCSLKKKPEIEVLKDEDIEKLLSTQSHKVEGTRSELENKFQQLSATLSSMSGSIFQSVKKPESAARSLHAAAAAAAQLADTARGLKDEKKPIQSKKIEDAAHEMCLSTYDLLKTSEVLCQNPDHHDTRRRLLEACYHLNDSINKLNRVIHPEPTISRECNELLRVLQIQRSVLQSAVQPAASSPYTHCIDALHSQRDLLLNLNSDQAMAREEFLKSMLFVTTAVTNSTECAAQATYLLSVSEKDKSVAVEGLVDVPKMKKSIASIHDTCVCVILDPVDQVGEEKRLLENQVAELIKDLDESVKKTKDEDVKKMLKKHSKNVESSAKSLYNVINKKEPGDVVISFALGLDDDIARLSKALEQPALVPTAGQLSRNTQALCEDVLKHSTTLVSNTQELIKEIKSAPEQSEVLKWTSFSKRKDVLSAFDALLKSIKSCGQKANILEAEEDGSEQKSHLQTQTETAFKWLHKPMAKSDVKANGQQAVKNLIDIGKKMSEDLQGADKEDLRHVVEETEQLLMHCSKKYDQEQYSLLMERIRELKKAIERMAVTRVVEDFIDTEEPLADLDILADAERDENSRNFLLERKIAELLAQLGRVSRTATLVAHTATAGPHVSTQLRTCSEQTELLAPMLVKAAQERVHKPDDKMVIENYKTLLAKYTASLSKVRELCDQSVEPMEFVQAAGDTMQRMREDSINDDPMKCALTSAAITKLANRVIHVSLSSRSARDDPELQRALTDAQHQLSAATPSPDTRASKMPDWKDTTAKILHATGKVESVLGGEAIFNKEPDTNQPIYNEALNLHVAIRDWSSRDNEIVAVAKRMAVLMAKLSAYMNTDNQHEVLTTSKSIVSESREVARLAKKLAHECTDHRIKTNLLQVCERIPTISGQLKMLTTVKGSSLGHQGSHEDKEAMDMLVGNAQSLMISIQDVVKAAASASVKIMSQRGPKIKWVRKTYY